MGYVARVGDVIKNESHQYKIIKEINKGGFADSYKARRNDGLVVFLKQYKSPSKLVPWFNDYFKYEDELNKRLREDPILKSATIYSDEVFLAKVYKSDGINLWTRNESIFQTFPFVTGNTHLGDMIEKGPEAFDWEKKVYACAVFAFALRKLHDIDIVHCDLKPENVQVKLDPSIAIKYRPLLIDMDWSILSDKRAPWHGYQGYVGTPGYTSPEHLRNEAPLEASDVFTASLIMFQLLTGKHPFASLLGSEDLTKAILSGDHDFKKAPNSLVFEGDVTDNLKKLLLDALDPNPRKRPTMEAIHLELIKMCKDLGKPKTSGHAKLPEKKLVEAAPTRPPAPAPACAAVSRAKMISTKRSALGRTLTLSGDAGEISTTIAFVFDQCTLRRVTSMSRFADPVKQFEVNVDRAGKWVVRSNTAASNHTCLNGKVLADSFVPLASGDVITLCGKTSGKSAMTLKVKIS